MLIISRNLGYLSNRKYVHGKGFVDSLTSSLRSIGSYVSQNRDLIAKPLLGALGNLAATGLEEGTKAIMKHVINKNTKTATTPPLDSKSLSILQNIIGNSDTTKDIPVSNILGSGIKKF